METQGSITSGGLPMQLFFVFSFPHGPGMRLEGCLFFFRPYLSPNSNDKPRPPVLSPKCSSPKSLKNPYICLRIKIFQNFSKFSVKTKSRCLLIPKLNNFFINKIHQGLFQRRLTSFQGKNPKFKDLEESARNAGASASGAF